METEEIVSAYYAVLQAGGAGWDRDRLRALLAEDLKFEGPIAGRVQGSERFVGGVSGFIEANRGITFLHRLTAGNEAGLLYDAALPHGTVRFAEFLEVREGLIRSIRLLYDPLRYREAGGG